MQGVDYNMFKALKMVCELFPVNELEQLLGGHLTKQKESADCTLTLS